MPNLFTRVPDREPVPLAPHSLMVRVADLFMKVMYSTPPSGTLANTWVTPATFWLCVLCAPGLFVVGCVAIAAAHWWTILLSIVCWALALGSAAVVGVAIAQKR